MNLTAPDQIDKIIQDNQYKYLELISRSKKYGGYNATPKDLKSKIQQVKKFPLFRKGRYKGGFIYTQNSKRELPFQLLASRTIGRYNENSKPLSIFEDKSLLKI